LGDQLITVMSIASIGLPIEVLPTIFVNNILSNNKKVLL